MKRALYILLALILISVFILYFVRKNFIQSGEIYYSTFITHKNPEDKELIFVDKNGDPFFSKTIVFGGELSLDELDNISQQFLDRRCNPKEKLNRLFTTIFIIDYNMLKEFHTGCMDNLPDNIFKRYGVYKYIIDYGNKKFVDKAILDKINYSSKIYGLQGLSNYLFGRPYGDLTINEKIYLFYKIEEKDNPQLTFEDYKTDIFKINDNSQLRLVKNKINLNQYPHITDAIIKELEEYGLDRIAHKAIIHTSFDPDAYEKVKKVLNDYFENKDPKLQSAGVVIDSSKGEIITLYGGKQENSRINRALNLKRQVGSIFKPVVYLAAFENGIKPSDIIEDKPTTFGKGKNAYSPKNFDDFYMGKTKVENALIYSLNNGTLQVALKTGLNNVANMAQKLGLEAKPLLGFCLGSGEYTVLQIAKYFSVIANNGIKKRIGFVKSIENTDNASITPLDGNEERIVSEETVKTIQEILKKVVKIGTARGTGLLKGTYGKTGTTNDSRDVWFASVYDKYVIVVWIGRDDYKTMGEKDTGGSLAAPLVARIQRSLITPME
ncbi:MULTISPECIES: transglycosylase domain-containing protein [Calditerrivibrio]